MIVVYIDLHVQLRLFSQILLELPIFYCIFQHVLLANATVPRRVPSLKTQIVNKHRNTGNNNVFTWKWIRYSMDFFPLWSLFTITSKTCTTPHEIMSKKGQVEFYLWVIQNFSFCRVRLIAKNSFAFEKFQLHATGRNHPFSQLRIFCLEIKPKSKKGRFLFTNNGGCWLG